MIDARSRYHRVRRTLFDVWPMVVRVCAWLVVFVVTSAVWAVAAPRTDGPPSAAAVDPPVVRIPKVSRPPRLEDFVEGREREAEASLSGFRQREPRDGRPVSRDTSAYLSYDDQNLYVVFVCKDDPANVRARMTKREDITDDDRVTIYLDSFHDGQRAYIFSSNPLGIQRDGVATEGQGADIRFDTVWYTQGRLTRDGFAVWMAIPFKSLRFRNTALQRWGIALQRTLPTNSENSYWPYITLRQGGVLRQLATLEGLDGIASAHNIQINPYGTFTGTRLLDSSTPGFATTEHGRVGLDAKFPLGSALALDATANPDFSQIESDDPQVLVNQRYEVIFPEKRPFFLENAGYFRTPINLFFSRRVADPEFGAHLTGKVGQWGIGAVAADDRADGRRVDPSNPLSGNRAGIGVARLQREFGTNARIGGLFSTRDFGPVQNHVASFDTRLALTPNWSVTGQAARSYDRRQDGGVLQGSAYSADLLHSGAHLGYEGNYLDISPDFRSQVGHIRRVDTRRTEHYVGYSWRPQNSKVLSFGPGSSVGGDWDHAGQLQDLWFNIEFAMDLAGPVGFRASRYDAYEYYLSQGFRYSVTGGSFYVSTANWLSVDGSYHAGSAINYSPAPGLEPSLGNSQDASFGFTVRPSPRMSVQEYYYYAALGSRPNSIGAASTRRIFDNHVMRTKINYQVTRAISFRGIIDYYGLFPDPTLIAQDKYKSLTGDVLFTCLVRPGTALYIGYDSRLENIILEPTTPASVRTAVSQLQPTGRQVFVKMSYLFRF